MIRICVVKHHLVCHLEKLSSMHHVKEAGSTVATAGLEQGLIIKTVEVVGSKDTVVQRRHYSFLDHAGSAPHSLVPVDSLVHQILGEKDVLHRRNAGRKNAYAPLRMRIYRRKNKLDVLGAIGNTAEKGIPGQVVQLVRIQHAGKDVAEELHCRIRSRQGCIHDCGRDGRVYLQCAPDNGSQRFCKDVFSGKSLVLFKRKLLEGVGVWEMAQVVKQTGTEERIHILHCDLRAGIEGDEAPDHPVAHMVNPQAVNKAGVHCPRIDQIGGAQLPYAVHLLKHRGGYYFLESLRQHDAAPHRIPHRIVERGVQICGCAAVHTSQIHFLVLKM